MLENKTSIQVDMVQEKLVSAQQTMMEMQQQQFAEAVSRQARQMSAQQQHAEEQQRQAALCQKQMLDRLMQTVAQMSSNSGQKAVRLEDALTSRLDEMQRKQSDFESRLDWQKLELPSHISQDIFQSTPVVPYGMQHENMPPPTMPLL